MNYNLVFLIENIPIGFGKIILYVFLNKSKIPYICVGVIIVGSVGSAVEWIVCNTSIYN